MPRTNIAQFGVEQEGTPGTAETLAAANVLVRLREGYTFTPDHQLVDLNEVSDVSSMTPAVIGRRAIRFSTNYILRGPGDTTTDPAIAPMLEAAMLVGADVYTIAANTFSGTLLCGEVITGGTSAGTGMVVQQTGGTSVSYLVLSGVLQSGETLTGGTSGETCAATGAPAVVGYGFRPADSSDLSGHCCTCEGIRGGTTGTSGYVFKGRGCLADLAFAFTNGGPCIVTQNFLGALASQGDQATYTVSAYPEADVTVPKFLNAGLVLGTYSPSGVVSLNLDYPTNPTLIEDANDASADGVKHCDYSRGLPTVRLDVDQVDTGTYDYFATLQAGTTMYVEWTMGSAAGAKWTFAAPAAQFRSIDPTGREPNRATFGIELGLTGANNNELFIWQH